MKYGMTAVDFEDLIVTALDGGIGYWACLDNTRPVYKTRRKTELIDVFTANLLLKGGTVYLLDNENMDTVWELTMDKVMDGIDRYVNDGYDALGIFSGPSPDMYNMDAEAADCIIQLGLFGELVYG